MLDQKLTHQKYAAAFEVTVDDLLAEPPIDIVAEIIRRRAEAIVAADAAGLPRRPIGVVVEEFAKADRRRLSGFRLNHQA